VNQRCERERLTGGPTGQRDPLDSDTETGEKLVAGETRQRRGLGRIQGHQHDPLTKADLPRCGNLSLPSSRGPVGVNGGAAGDTPACTADAVPVEVHAKHQ